MHNEKRLLYAGIGLALMFAIAYLIGIDYISFPWRDEIGTSDTAVNVVLNGQWASHVWKYSYNPLHAFLLIGWLKIWGVSHFTVCSFTVLLAFISFLLLLKILLKRGLLVSFTGIILFSLLFWGGFKFASLITLGRTDLLVMTFTMLVVNELTPMKDGSFYNIKRWPLIVYSFFLMASSIYSIPALCCYCFVVFFLNREKAIRKELRWRYFYAIIGFTASFFLVCLFFYSVHGLFKFINSYLSFNATINHDDKGRGLLTRLLDAYMLDIYALVVLAITISLYAIQKRIKNKFYIAYFLFVLAIPMLMVFAGRYRFYYSWIYYVPVAVLASCAVDKLRNKWLTMSVLSFVLIMAIMRPVVLSKQFEENRELLNRVEDFVEDCSSYLTKGDNVLFNNSMFYYSIVDRRYVPWQKYKGLQEIPQPEEKFKAFIEKKFKDEEKRQQLLSIFNKMEHSDPYLPESGFFITEGNDEYNNTVDFLQNHKYNVGKLYENNGFALIKFNINKK